MNSVPIVRSLLARPDIAVNVEDREGETPLLSAIMAGHTEVAEVLLNDPNIDVNRNRSGLESRFLPLLST